MKNIKIEDIKKIYVICKDPCNEEDWEDVRFFSTYEDAAIYMMSLFDLANKDYNNFYQNMINNDPNIIGNDHYYLSEFVGDNCDKMFFPCLEKDCFKFFARPTFCGDEKLAMNIAKESELAKDWGYVPFVRKI